MSDNLPIEGTFAHPLRFDPFQRLLQINFGRGIGVLTVDMPDGVRLSFEPSESRFYHGVGDVIARKDFAKFDDETGTGHPAPVSMLITPSMIIGTLYGEGNKAWAVRKVRRSPGPDPGYHNEPPSFLPDTGIPENTFPNPAWVEYRDNYNEEKRKFLERPNTRWIEVADLKSLGDDTLTTGEAQIYFGPGDRWADLHYGEVALYHFKYVPYDPPHYTIMGVQAYQTILADAALRAPGNIGYAPGFNIFEAVKIAPYGVGEEQVAGNPGRKAIRQIYFLDFDVIDKGVAPGVSNSVKVSSEGGSDPQLPSFNMVFVFQLFGGSTKFTVRPLQVESSAPASYNQRRTFPYTRAGELFRLNRSGFVPPGGH